MEAAARMVRTLCILLIGLPCHATDRTGECCLTHVNIHRRCTYVPADRTTSKLFTLCKVTINLGVSDGKAITLIRWRIAHTCVA